MTELLGLRRHGRDPLRDRGRPARRPLDRPAHQDRAVRPEARPLRRARRGAAGRDRADHGGGLLLDDDRRLQLRRALPGAGDRADRPGALAPRWRSSTSPTPRKVELWERRTSAGPNGDYKRYELHRRTGLADGDPGRGGRPVRVHRHRARRGRAPGATTPELHTAMQTKRWRKLAAARRTGSRVTSIVRRRAARRRAPRLRLDLGRRARGGRDLRSTAGCRWARSTRACSAPLPGRAGQREWSPAGDARGRARGELHRPVRAPGALRVRHPGREPRQGDGLPFTADRTIQDVISDEGLAQLSTARGRQRKALRLQVGPEADLVPGLRRLRGARARSTAPSRSSTSTPTAP